MNGKLLLFLVSLSAWAQSRLIPHLTSSTGGFQSTLILENSSDLPQPYQLQGKTAAGALTISQAGTLQPGQTVWQNAASWLGASAAYLVIQPGTAEAIEISVAYQASSGVSSAAHLRSTSDYAPRWRLFAGNWDEVFDGVAVINMGSQVTQVTLHQLDGGDAELASLNLIPSLAPGAKALAILGAPGNQPIGNRQDVVYEVRSAQPLALTALRGTLLGAPINLLWSNAAWPLAARGVPSGDLIIDGQTVSYGQETLDVHGNLIVRNGGVLNLNGTHVKIHSSYEEEFTIQVLDSSTLNATHARLEGVDYQTALIARHQGDAHPSLSFEQCVATNHAGIRVFGRGQMNANKSNLEEVQVHDQAQIRLTGGTGIYPVLFFEIGQSTLSGFVPGNGITGTLNGAQGWSFDLQNVGVSGYQIDVEKGAYIFLNDCAGITASFHTPGNLAFGEVTVSNATGTALRSGKIEGLGPEIEYTNSQILQINAYVNGADKVIFQNCRINEANTLDTSKLTLQQCQVVYNLLQAYDLSELKVLSCSIDGEEETPPSLTALDNSRVEVKNSDCSSLRAQAIQSGRIDFDNASNLNPALLTVQDQGQIWVDGVRLR